MLAPIPFHKFRRLVMDHGCYVEQSGKEWIVRAQCDGTVVSRFAVSHKKGGRREVKSHMSNSF